MSHNTIKKIPMPIRPYKAQSKTKPSPKKTSMVLYLKKKGIETLDKINQGGFGQIYRGKISAPGQLCAVKCQPRKVPTVRLIAESKIYSYLIRDSISFNRGIPHIYYCGYSQDQFIIAMQMMGPSLENLKGKCQHQKFSLRTILLLVNQMINTIHYVHDRNIIHHDIKPDNFCIGSGQYSHNLYLIDFGLAKHYRDNQLKHIQCVNGKHLTGTVRYASVNMHKGLLQSRRDDMQSIGYVMLYLYTGTLPWCNIQAKDKTQKHRKIRQIKQSINLMDLCKGCPVEFIKYMAKVRKLRFDEEPPYEQLREMFRKLYEKRGYSQDIQYDWTYSYAYDSVSTQNSNNTIGSKTVYPVHFDKHKKILVKDAPIKFHHDDFHPFKDYDIFPN